MIIIFLDNAMQCNAMLFLMCQSPPPPFFSLCIDAEFILTDHGCNSYQGLKFCLLGVCTVGKWIWDLFLSSNFSENFMILTASSHLVTTWVRNVLFCNWCSRKLMSPVFPVDLQCPHCIIDQLLSGWRHLYRYYQWEVEGGLSTFIQQWWCSVFKGTTLSG